MYRKKGDNADIDDTETNTRPTEEPESRKEYDRDQPFERRRVLNRFAVLNCGLNNVRVFSVPFNSNFLHIKFMLCCLDLRLRVRVRHGPRRKLRVAVTLKMER